MTGNYYKDGVERQNELVRELSRAEEHHISPYIAEGLKIPVPEIQAFLRVRAKCIRMGPGIGGLLKEWVSFMDNSVASSTQNFDCVQFWDEFRPPVRINEEANSK